MQNGFLTNGPDDAEVTILLGHGAGGAMDSTSMTAAAEALGTVGFRVVRFEFAYMAARRTSDGRKPPPRADRLIPEYVSAINQLAARGPLIIGGKSMGGRVASMVADELFREGKIVGLVCLGYPFHPPGKPDQLRTKHLETLKTPTLIVQGTRDEFGTREEVRGYSLSSKIDVVWLEDGDHDLRPRKKISGFSFADHQASMARAVRDWASGKASKLSLGPVTPP